MSSRAPSASAGGGCNLSAPAPIVSLKKADRWHGIKKRSRRPSSSLAAKIASVVIAVLVLSSSFTPLVSPSSIILPFAAASANIQSLTGEENEARRSLVPGLVSFRNTPPESTTSTVQEGAIYSNLKKDNASFIYETHAGTYRYSKQNPYEYSYYYTDSSQHVTSSLFWVQTVDTSSSPKSSNQTLQGGNADNSTSTSQNLTALSKGKVVEVTALSTLYQVTVELLNDKDNSTFGYLTTKFEPQQRTPKFTAIFQPYIAKNATNISNNKSTTTTSSYRIVWAVSTAGKYLLQQNATTLLSSVVDLQNLATSKNIHSASNRLDVGFTSNQDSWRTWTHIDWSDYYSGSIDGSTRISSAVGPIDLGSVFSGNGILVSFPINASYVDPIVIGQSTSSIATGLSFQRKTFDYQQYHYAFFYNGSDILYRTSLNGSSWNTPASAGSNAISSTWSFSVFQKGSKVALAWIGSDDKSVFFRKGSLSGATISWNNTVTLWNNTAGNTAGGVNVAIDSNGYYWVAAGIDNTTAKYYLRAWKSTDGSSFSSSWNLWTNGGSNPISNSYLDARYSLPSVLPLPSGKVQVIATSKWSTGQAGPYLRSLIWNGSSWSTEYNRVLNLTKNVTPYNNYSATADTSGNIHLLYTDNQTRLNYVKFSQSSKTWSASPTILSAGVAKSPSISRDDLDIVYASWIENSQINLARNFTSWESSKSYPFGSSFDSPNYLSATYNFSAYYTAVWREASSSPYNIRFGLIPTLAESWGYPIGNKPWNKEGLSPYGQYFSSVSEYVSPGNGLLVVKQSDLVLQGRGLDLAVERVFVTPRLFLDGAAYAHPAYPWANLGDGWELNFPWIDDNYLHLWDGQRFLINYTGNVFEHHNSQNFKFYHNSNGTYTLFMTEGTQYNFDSARKLTSIVDRTGSNSITFTYSGSKISYITDTAGRNVYFSYNAQNQVSGFSSSNRVVNYTYSSGKLVSVSDPAGRRTNFTYTSSLNSWLISGVKYPTGSNTTYSYGSAGVGAKALTYLVTLQNVYAGGALERSSSFSYEILNGNIEKNNAQQSDGNRQDELAHWLSGWSFRKSHVINSTSGAGANYTVKITVNKGSGTDSGGSVYLNNRAMSWPNDIRFTDDDGVTELNYWMESSDTSVAAFWVKVRDNLTASSATIYVYYGKLGVSSTSNGQNVFLFFDDFTGSSLDTNKWNTPHHPDAGTSESVHDGLLDINVQSGYEWTGASILSKTTFATGNYTVTTKVKFTNFWSSAYGAYAGFTNAATYDDVYYGEPTKLVSAVLWEVSSDWKFLRLFADNIGPYAQSSSSITIRNKWFEMITLYRATTYAKGTWTPLDNPSDVRTLQLSGSGGISPTYLVIGIGDYGTAEHTYFDYVFVRKSVSSEPGHGSWGSEQQPADVRVFNDFSTSASTDWNYRKSHVINTASGAGTNYPVKITVHKGSGTDSGGDVYLNGRSINWPNDIRFRASNATTELDHWLETSDSNTATFWVKVRDNLTASSSTIYIYYGKAGAASASNGTNTFDFFDDFSGSFSKWTTQAGSASISGGVLRAYPTANYGGVRSASSISLSSWKMMEASVRHSTYSNMQNGVGFYDNTDANTWYQRNNVFIQSYAYSANRIYWGMNENSNYHGINSGITTDTNWHRNKILVKQGSYPTLYYDTYSYQFSYNVPTATYYLWLPKAYNTNSPNEYTDTDWIFVRKYVSPEPTQGGWGSEERSLDTVATPIYDANNARLRQILDVFDTAGNPTQEDIYIGESALSSFSSANSYDNWGNVIKTTDTMGHVTYYSYVNTNSTNQFVGSSGFTNSFYNNSAVNSNIHNLPAGSAEYQNGSGSAKIETYFKYDSAGNLVEQKQLHDGGWLTTSYTYDNYGNRLSTTNARGNTTYYRYSSSYQSAYLTKTSQIVSGQNVTTLYGYDFNTGYLVNSTLNGARTTSYQYDILGRVTKKIFPAAVDGGVKANQTFTYFDSNSTVAIYDEKGNMTRQYYDQLGRLYKTAWYNGTTALYSNSSQSYDWRDNINSTITVMGNTFTNKYDSLGRLVNATNPNNTFSTASYLDLNMTRVTYDGKGNKTVEQYDYQGRLVLTRSYLNASYYYATTYAYDQVGNLLKTVDPQNRVTTNVYDDINRLTRTNLPDGSYVAKSYDAAGNVVSMVDRNGNNLTYTYDEANRLTKIRYPNSTWTEYRYSVYGERTFMNNTDATYYYQYDNRGRLINQTQTMSGSTFTVFYSYDLAGNLVSVTYPDGSTVAYAYDFLNRVKQVGSYANFTYAKDGRVATAKYGNGISTTYSYDVMRSISRILTTRANGSSLLDLNYTYDKVGNILSINTETYRYDALNQLISSNGPWGSTSYTYDSVGNRLTKTEGGSTVNYTYGSYNRLISSSNPQTSYTYDSDGDMLSRSGGGTTWNYTWAWSEYLTKVTKNGTVVAQYYYDGDGGRVKTVEGSVTTLYGAGFEKITSNNTLVKVISGNGMIARIVNGTVRYYHANHIGSTRLVTDATGSIVFNSNYRPFGAQINQTGSDPFKFQGRREDSPTGLYYLGNRYYDSDLGRYISNSFIFAGNNPLGIATTSTTTKTNTVQPNKVWNLKDYTAWLEQYGAEVASLLFTTSSGLKPFIGYGYHRWKGGVPAQTWKSVAGGFWVIELNPLYFSGKIQPDLGALIHEFAHVVQGEKWHWGQQYSWLKEGVADYVRYLWSQKHPGMDPNAPDLSDSSLLTQDITNGDEINYHAAAYYVKYWEDRKPGWLLNLLNSILHKQGTPDDFVNELGDYRRAQEIERAKARLVA